MSNADKLILSLCDFSGEWVRPYKLARYSILQIDLMYGSDVRLLELPDRPVYGILAAPPCTYFANSGARWKRTDEQMREGLSIVDACLRFALICQPHFWVLENPIGKLKRYLGEPKLRFNPCDYGDPYTKKTCLWGKFNLPKARPVKPALGSRIHFIGPSKDRAIKRSLTPSGFAKAFFEANR
jgi:site-specific DNA-cytosine methylase